MKKTISITFLELEKLLKKREFLFGLLMSLVMGGGMAYGAYAFPDSVRRSYSHLRAALDGVWVVGGHREGDPDLYDLWVCHRRHRGDDHLCAQQHDYAFYLSDCAVLGDARHPPDDGAEDSGAG